ncbi:acyltransferase family protein [Pseudofulvimonas gallinarii]|uniref:Peptidoglycan/LPS O-acetylase OafA/YrhL n=1 Tax=Pseudofulvimonas gallinarii TaxID=634155 RepID=A0A4R3LKT2_9GAMM|nr:acyltransferase [Pseudofulvimonas gallinarii]TCT00814.1 peptidoglycan/LPS O-acetylase OafA/YrhL [Pseudofulvimonas gallinarii]THD12846.1 hypothetical protein B1808_11125 [Pseudofulvimonas gallinarii]
MSVDAATVGVQSAEQSSRSNGARVWPVRLEALDALRALAALMVVAYHLFELSPVVVKYLLLWPPNPYGWIGVDLFFVLSGFFIGRLVIQPARFDGAHFMRRRAWRILPAYYLSMLLIIVLAQSHLLESASGWWQITSHVLLIHHMIPGHHGGINGVYWTLGVEWQFYLLMLLLAPWLRRPRALPWLLLAGVLMCWGWRAWIFLAWPEDSGVRFRMATQLPGMLDLFVAGIATAWISLRHPQRLRRWAHWLLPWAVLACVIACAFVQRHLGDFWHHAGAMVFARSGLALAFGLLVLAMLYPPRWLLAGFRWLGLAAVGRWSYSLYLAHLPILLALWSRVPDGLDSVGWLWVLAGYLALVLAVSALAWRLVEWPCMARGRTVSTGVADAAH